MKYRYAAVTDVGKREINEDSLLTMEGRYGLACALADGLGGQGFGDVASQIAVEAVGEQLKGWFPVGKRRMTACVEEANRRVRRKQNEQSVPMMTTLSLLRTNGPYVHIAHVGDTRIYWFRNERILYQSTDHSVTQMMVTCGELSPEQVRGQPDFSALWQLLEPMLAGRILVAHNAPFDLRVLASCLHDYHIDWQPEAAYLCTCQMGKRAYPYLPNHKLNTLCDHLQLSLDHHKAGSDSRACALLLLNYLEKGLQPEAFLRTYRFADRKTIPYCGCR